MTDDRYIVLSALLAIEKDDLFTNVVIRDVLDKYSFLERQERAFIKRLIEGVIERKIELDYIIDSKSKVKTGKMKPAIRNILRMGVYQILYMDSVPDSAAVSEAVKLAKKKGFASLSGFVNGVLRSFTRDKTVVYPDKSRSFVKYASIKYSMPLWIIDHFLEKYDEKVTETILNSFLTESGMSVRTNCSKIEPSRLEEQLKEEGVNVTPSEYLPYAFLLDNLDSVTRLDSFRNGEFQIMDVSSMMVCHLAGIRKDSLVMDLCAAPGGKALHAADILAGSGRVIARDISDMKVELIEDNLSRCGFTNVVTEKWSALEADPEYFDKADVVICDLPCSGLGIIGRKADIKYRVKAEDLDSLALLQRDMLKVAVRYLKKGGTLVFSTCTIDTKENEANVKFIIDELGLRPASIEADIPRKLMDDIEKYSSSDPCNGRENYITILPGLTACDGFFVSKFLK